MVEHIINNFIELHKVLEHFRRDSRWSFRGQSRSAWPLLPKAGRKPFNNLDDFQLFEHWKRWGFQYFEREYQYDLDYLTLGQHHGLATRLLDWTENPLVATYFAINENENDDGVLYAVRINKFVLSNANPWKGKGIKLFIPKSVGQRVVRQWGCFSLHSPPTLPINQITIKNEDLHRILFKRSIKKKLRFDLYRYGIGSEMLFPGLDGWSIDANWQFMNIKEWYDLKELIK